MINPAAQPAPSGDQEPESAATLCPVCESGNLPQSQTPESALRRIEALLREVIRAGGFNLRATTRKATPGDEQGPEWIVDLSGPDSDELLASRAELLDALADIASKGARVEGQILAKISFDCKDYRRTRAAELKLTAQLAAGRAIESGEPFALNPMDAADRRTVHLALKDRPEVRTESQGAGPARHVVILPASPPRGRRR
ncbi:MAG: protein jag [Terriglobia bacterium]